MIRRLRAAAPTTLLLGLAVMASLTAFAQMVKEPAYVTTGELHRAVIITFLSGAGIVLAGLAWVYSRDQRSRDMRADTAIQAAAEQGAETARQIRELAGIVREHHEDWAMHPAGSTGRIDRMEGKLDGLIDGQSLLREEFHALRMEHDVIRETERCLMGRVRRNPADSPTPRREDDPPDFDGTKRRGRA